MSWSQYLFSFRGRINRARYWRFVGLTLLFTAAMLAGIGIGASRGVGRTPPLVPIVVGVLVFAAFIVFVVASLAIYTKRLHDRGKSAWWLVLFTLLPATTNVLARAAETLSTPSAQALGALIGLIGLPFSIWGFIEIACLRGTEGTNRYGADPLGPGESVAEVFS